MTGPSITCPVCGRTSHNPNDVREGFCGACHAWTGAAEHMVHSVPFEIEQDMYYDRQGHPITLARYAWLIGYHTRTEVYKRIALDDIGLYRVSTVWLGANHNWTGVGPPIIFETMVFLAGSSEDWGMHRYATEEQALAGHEAVCAEIRELDRQAAKQEHQREDR